MIAALVMERKNLYKFKMFFLLLSLQFQFLSPLFAQMEWICAND